MLLVKKIILTQNCWIISTRSARTISKASRRLHLFGLCDNGEMGTIAIAFCRIETSGWEIPKTSPIWCWYNPISKCWKVLFKHSCNIFFLNARSVLSLHGSAFKLSLAHKKQHVTWRDRNECKLQYFSKVTSNFETMLLQLLCFWAATKVRSDSWDNQIC